MEVQQGSEGEEEKGFLLPSDPASYHSTCLFFRLAFKCWECQSACLVWTGSWV